jgi:Transposase
LKTARAYLLREGFQQLRDYSAPSRAGKFLDEWRRQSMRSRIEPMKKIARSLRQHRELILNYFRAQKMISSGVVEGLNNKAKVTLRKSYGFRTYRVLDSPYITRLASCLSRNAPTISSDEPKILMWALTNSQQDGVWAVLRRHTGAHASLRAR